MNELINTAIERAKDPTPGFWKKWGWIFSFIIGALASVLIIPGIPEWIKVLTGIFMAGLSRVQAEFGSSDPVSSKK